MHDVSRREQLLTLGTQGMFWYCSACSYKLAHGQAYLNLTMCFRTSSALNGEGLQLSSVMSTGLHFVALALRLGLGNFRLWYGYV